METTVMGVMDICANCGGSVPQHARFCPSCGAAQASDGPARAVATDVPDRPQKWSWCEIEWVRSFRGSEFEARPLDPDGDVLERSPTFRWREKDPPPEGNADAREAHENLVQMLVGAGWEPVGEVAPWYAERFRRPAEREVSAATVDGAGSLFAARLGKAVLTLLSSAVILFTLLVLLGFFVR